MLSDVPEGFFKVCQISTLSESLGKRFTVDDEDVALFLVKGKVYALSNICPHQHSSIIADGFLERGHVICPAHGWKFSLADGRQPDGRKGLDPSDVIVIDGDVYVKPFKKKYNW